MNRRLFREEALARRGRAEPLDGLLRVTAPHMWVVLAGLTVVLGVAVAWALFDRVDETVDADCLVVLPGERYAVLAEEAGTIEEVLVDVGETVGAGQPLARIRTPSLDLQLRVARSVLERLQAQPGESDEVAARASTAAARAEVDELEAIRAAGQIVSSPVAGEIASHQLVRGQAVEAGTHIALVRTGDSEHLEAVAFVPQRAAQLVRTGQHATVVPTTGAGSAADAVVTAVSDRSSTVADWLSDLGLPSRRGNLVRLSLAGEQAPGAADGDLCRLRIVVRTHAPISLLGIAGLNTNGST